MNQSTDDLGVITALLKRFEEQRLPHARYLQERVMQGEKLNESDIAFLEDVLATAQDIQPLIDRHPEYEKLLNQMVSLYKDITEKALENEQ